MKIIILPAPGLKMVFLILAYCFLLCSFFFFEETAAVKPGESFRQVLLTFDDGPDPLYTPQILSVLRQYNVKALFFVLGSRAQSHPELLGRIAREGHALGNHGFTHVNIDALSYEQFVEEIILTDRIISEVTGEVPGWFRPPRGRISPENLAVIRQEGKEVLLWDAGLEKEQLKTAKKMVDYLLDRIKKKDSLILLLHDGDLTGHDRTATVEALPSLIEKLRQQGFDFIDPLSAEGKQFILGRVESGR